MSELIEPGHERADMNTIGRAIREGWIIPEKAMEYIPRKLLEQIAKGEDEVSLKASALFLKLVEQNEARDRPRVDQSVNVQVNNGGTIAANTDSGGGRAIQLLERIRERLAAEQPPG
jgi:hypothetical protein